MYIIRKSLNGHLFANAVLFTSLMSLRLSSRRVSHNRHFEFSCHVMVTCSLAVSIAKKYELWIPLAFDLSVYSPSLGHRLVAVEGSNIVRNLLTLNLRLLHLVLLPGTSSSRPAQEPLHSSPRPLLATPWPPARSTLRPPGRCRGTHCPALPSSSRSRQSTALGGEKLPISHLLNFLIGFFSRIVWSRLYSY